MVDFTITQNDTYPAISGRFEDDASPIDLTGATINFHMKSPGASSVKVDAAASILGSASDGRVAYQWQLGDTDTSGFYQAEWEVTYSDGYVETFPDEPLEIYIRPELA